MPTSSKKPKKRLMLIDGHAVLHRAWHALPPLTTRDGRVISGAYGFMMTLLGAIKKFQPTHLAVAFDLEAPTFRHEQYKEYKATRKEQPDELYEQIPIIEEVLELMNIPVIGVEGYEADDAIGTATYLASKKDKKIETIIVTGDLDTLQLVTPRVRVFTMRRGLSDTVIYDPAQVEARYGLKPSQMIDYKALRGDPSDNIPGVRGVGEKTATKLISEFGSVEKLYKSLEKGDKKSLELRESLRNKLIDGKEDALEALDLVRIRIDAPIDFDLKETEFELPDRSVVAALFEELQFNRLLKQWPKSDEDNDPDMPPDDIAAQPRKNKAAVKNNPQASLNLTSDDQPEMIMIKDKAAIKKLADQLEKPKKLAFRTLILENRPAFPEVGGLAIYDGKDTYFLDSKVVIDNTKVISDLFTDSKHVKYCHDLKREITALGRLGLALHGQTEDLMLASYLMLAGERKSELGSLLTFYRNAAPEPKKPTLEESKMRLAEEVSHLISLTDEFLIKLDQFRITKLYKEIELPLTEVLSRMERYGVLIDREYFLKLSLELEKRLDGLTSKIYKLAGEEFNINSPKQMQEILFEKLALDTRGLKRTTKGKELSTAASELEKLIDRHPIISEVMAYREAAKIKSTYVDALPELAHPVNNRIHAHFNQAVTATGRLSSSDPNLQNIPTKDNVWAEQVRKGFIAKKGYVLLAADYSQVELRIAAHFAEEKTMIEAFKNGEDIHWRTAVTMFGKEEAENKRRVAKAINFGILYGMGANRLAASAGISKMEAKEYIDQYFALLPNLAQYVEEMKAKVANDGYVETLFGRKRFFGNFHLMNRREQAEAERQAVNTPLQGTQADMIKLAMIRLDEALPKKLGGDAKMIIQVHDELIFEVKESKIKEAIKIIVPTMKDVIELKVPIEVDVKVGENWGEMKEIKQ